LAIAQQLSADRPIFPVMFVNEDLCRTAFEFENIGHDVGNGRREAAAFLQGTTLGDVHGDKRHEILPSRPLL